MYNYYIIKFKGKRGSLIKENDETKIGFMFKVSNSSDDKKYDGLMKIRKADVLRNKCFDEWNKYELLQLVELYYQYFNKHRNSDLVWDINEYVISGQYEKDRNE